MDTTITGLADGTVTLADVAGLVRRWSTQGPTDDLDHYLADHLTGKRVSTGTRTFTITGVVNAGFNGQAIHGRTDDGRPAVHYIR